MRKGEYIGIFTTAVAMVTGNAHLMRKVGRYVDLFLGGPIKE